MTTEQIKNEINSDKYDFLRTNPHLGNNIILLTVGGSHAYGTDVEGSDIDVRGIAVERKQELLGLSNFEQFENRSTDTTIYALRKIVSLLLNSNPNVIEMLGTKDEHYFILNPEGEMLKNNIDLFLSKRAVHSFGGYATAQLRRLQNALARDSYPQAEKEKHILNSILNQMEHLKANYHSFTNEQINVYLDDTDREGYEQEIFMDINLSHYPLRDFKSIYSEMHNIVKDYGKLNHRNNKKSEDSLYKHAMHLVRLLGMGTEILEGKGVNTYREHDRGLLLDIRNGQYSYEDIFTMVDELKKKFKYAADNTDLPSKPSYNKINELIVAIHEMRLGL
jgi:predicted nucleotidyltransferase